MKLLRLRFPQQEQSVGWLELFFDLVYVASIIALGDWLSHHLNLEGILGFGLIFIPIWSTWVGTVIFLNRFNTNSIEQRLLVLLQMYFVIGLATHMSDPLGDLSQGFALSFVLVILVRILMHWRAIGEHHDAKPLITRYILGDIPLALIWFVSAFTPAPLRFWLWGAGVIWGFCVPLLPQMRLWGERARPDLHHLSERVGLFTIIVLGESFIKIVVGALGIEHQPLGLPGVLGMLVVISLWWIYFDHANATKVGEASVARFIWFFAHLPLAIGTIILGVTLKQVLLEGSSHSNSVGTTVILLSSLALCWSLLGVLELVTESRSAPTRSSLARGRFIGALILVVLGIVSIDLIEFWGLFFATLVSLIMIIQDVLWQNVKITRSST